MNSKKIMTKLSEALGRVNASYAVIAQKYNMSYNTLMIIYILDDCDHVTQKDICEKMYLSKSTVNGLLKDLKSRGYVELVQGRNKKEKYIVFTEEGKRVNTKIQMDTDKFEAGILVWLGEESTKIFLQQAEKVSCRMLETVSDVIKE